MKLKRKQLMQVNGTIFLIVALLHGLRVLNSWDLVVSTIEIPLWLSGILVLFTGYLCYENWNQAK